MPNTISPTARSSHEPPAALKNERASQSPVSAGWIRAAPRFATSSPLSRGTVQRNRIRITYVRQFYPRRKHPPGTRRWIRASGRPEIRRAISNDRDPRGRSRMRKNPSVRGSMALSAMEKRDGRITSELSRSLYRFPLRARRYASRFIVPPARRSRWRASNPSYPIPSPLRIPTDPGLNLPACTFNPSITPSRRHRETHPRARATLKFRDSSSSDSSLMPIRRYEISNRATSRCKDPSA